MPVTKGAIRKQRADKTKALINIRVKRAMREAVLVVKKKPSKATISKAFSAIDRAAKTHLIHKNKAARMKSRMAKKRK